MDKKREFNRETHIASYDLEKAFEPIYRESFGT
jgi:hypothetical protein